MEKRDYVIRIHIADSVEKSDRQRIEQSLVDGTLTIDFEPELGMEICLTDEIIIKLEDLLCLQLPEKIEELTPGLAALVSISSRNIF